MSASPSPSTGTVTAATFRIKDGEGNVIYSRDSFGEATTKTVLHDQYDNPLEVPLVDDFQIEVTTALDQLDNRNFTVCLYIAAY